VVAIHHHSVYQVAISIMMLAELAIDRDRPVFYALSKAILRGEPQLLDAVVQRQAVTVFGGMLYAELHVFWRFYIKWWRCSLGCKNVQKAALYLSTQLVVALDKIG